MCYEVFHFSKHIIDTKIVTDKVSILTEQQLKSFFNASENYFLPFKKSKPIKLSWSKDNTDMIKGNKNKDLIFMSVYKAAIKIKVSEREIINCIDTKKIFKNKYKINYINYCKYTSSILGKYFNISNILFFLLKISEATELFTLIVAFFIIYKL